MATFKIVVEFEDVKITKQDFKDGFLAMYPMKIIDDPDWVDKEDGSEAPKINEYPSIEALISDKGTDWYLRIANKGLAKIAESKKKIIKKSQTIPQE